MRIRRPVIVTGGELNLPMLDLKYNSESKFYQAPIHFKANGGVFLIDDFGRQLVSPKDLLNRWILPLEDRHDFLTVASGKKFQVPFEQLIIFSTNLEPFQLADEAFLRRIPYKIEAKDPSLAEFRLLFKICARQFQCEFKQEVVDYVVDKYYKPVNRPLRRCQPRDLMSQVKNLCKYQNIPMEMKSEYFDKVVNSYFTVVREQ